MRDAIADKVFQAGVHGAEAPELKSSLDQINEMIEDFEPQSEEQRAKKQMEKDMEFENFFSNLGWIK